MKKILIPTIAAGLAVLALSACNSGTTAGKSTSEASATTTASVVIPAQNKADVQEMLFLTVIRDKGGPSVHSYSDATLVSTAHSVCTKLDHGQATLPIALGMMSGGWDPKLAGGIMGAGVEAFCPEYSAQVQADFAMLGK